MTEEMKFDDIEKARRRKDLLNDPNYGIVLAFLDKFRSILDLPDYPLQLLEDHLVNYQETNSPRLIDFHFILLKRLSLAKNAQREKFDTIITKFTSRFDTSDSEQLIITGYLQSNIQIKIRILKNLLESQFDLNQTFRNALSDKSSSEIKSLPLGRDRFGVAYWYFMDKQCFVRLFREDVDLDRTWTIVAQNRDELEKFISLLITDFIVRKKFPDWTIDYEPFSSLSSSNEFEQHYSPISVNPKDKEIELPPIDDENAEVPVKKKRGPRPKRSTDLVKRETELTSNDDEKLDVSPRRKSGRRRRAPKWFDNKIDMPTKTEDKITASMSSDDEKSHLPIKRKRGRPKGSGKLSIQKGEEQILICSGSKRNSIVKQTNNNTHFNINEDQSQHDETSMDDISLAVRRSARFQQISVTEPLSKTLPPSSNTKKKRSMNNKTKRSTTRPRRRKTTISSSDEHIFNQSEDEYNSDDYLSNPTQSDLNDHFFELDDEENHPNNESFHPAKTAQTLTIIPTCCVCFQSDRPEVLLLCDDCNDAYHFECLHPMLLSLPDNDWFCPLCEHKKFSNDLIEKFKELLINYQKMETKEISKTSVKRKMKIKKYISDESLPASESEDENTEQSILSISPLSFSDENQINNISQRGRHRRPRFDMKQILQNHNFDSIDDREIANFNLQLPTKITRLIHRPDRSERAIKTLSTHFDHSSDNPNELNDKLDSPVVYVNSDANSHQMKSMITNSKQTSKIVRRWNDVQRRSRMKATNREIVNEIITADYTDENSNYHPFPSSHLNNNHNEMNNEDNTKIAQPTTVIPIDQYSSRNIDKKIDANFDRLTHDIQFAVSEVYSLPPTKTIDQQHLERIPKKLSSLYRTQIPPPSFFSKPSNDIYNIFRSKDTSALSNSNLSNIILTPPSSSSLLDTNDEQTIQMTNT